MEDLTWNCECQASSGSFGVPWRMWRLSFSSCLQPLGLMQLADNDESAHVGVVTLNLETNVFTGDSTKSFEQEIFQFQVTANFSILELELTPRGNVYGAIVLHLLGLCTSIQRLRVKLVEFL
ncbi:hypothetical protein E2562_019346, partial [Oryza meyeriana var. granulata]